MVAGKGSILPISLNRTNTEAKLMSHRSARLGMGIKEQTFRLCTLEVSHSIADRKGAHKYVLEKF